jgi:hypothetical protein
LSRSWAWVTPVLADVGQLSRPGGGLGGRTDAVEVLVEPLAELAGLERVLEQERRRALDVVVDDGRAHAPALRQQPHAAVVGRHERPLGRRQGTKSSPCACSPSIRSGPATPIGTCATPVKFSTLPGSTAGSSE